MKTRPEIHGVAVLARLRRMLSSGALTAGAMLALALPSAAQTATTVYFDDFNDQQNLYSGPPYPQTLAGSAPTTRSSTDGGSASAVWGSGAEVGGWGQRDLNDSNVATPTSSNFLPFTPDANRIYKLEMTVDTTPLGGGGGASWFAVGFTSSQHNWNGADAGTIDTAHLVRFNSNTVATITYTRSGADLVAAGINHVGWVTDLPGGINMNGAAQVKIDNFKLTAGVANPTVTYNGNGSDGGAVPTDGSSPYAYGNTVTVLNDGTMTRSGYSFSGWNTAADGTGTNYSPAATFTVEDNTTLYAKWIPLGSYTVTYDGNSNTSGSAPVDGSSPYSDGSTVTVLGNTGSLSRTSFTFSGWNTAADGTGTDYNPADTFTINADTTLYAKWTPGPDFVWNNGADTGNWNTTDANWTGATWSNSNNAIFNSVGGTVTLASGISAGSVTVGNTGINFANLTLTGGSLDATSLTVQGYGFNGGSYGSNPTLTVNSTVNLGSGDAAIGRANLDISGGTFTANRIISAPASADWARLVISGGTVTATNGIDGSVNTGATFAIDLNGGTLYTPSIKVADREEGTNNNAFLTFNGITVKATANNASFITTYGGGNNAFISNGGVIIDTNGHDIGIGTVLRNSSGQNGSLTKSGSGKLTLSYNTGGTTGTYSGATTVNEGVLELQSDTAWILYGGSAVTVNSGATLQGNNSLANQLNGLTLNNGTVSATGAGNVDWGNFYLTGNVTSTGTSTLNADIALRAANVDFNVASGGTLTVGGVMHNGNGFAANLTGGNGGGNASNVSKTGDGTLALTAANTYTGNTTVDAGTLSLGNGTSNSNLSDGGTVSIALGATVNLNFSGTDVVGKLIIDGQTMPAGLYDSTHPTYSSYFTGIGSLEVLEQSGTWTSTASGNWGTFSNWQSNVIATGADKTATFSAGTGVESITVTLDTARQIGNLAFSNATYTLAGSNTLTLDGLTTPTISVASGLNATISSKLAGTAGLEKNGAGTLTLVAGSGDNYYFVYNQNISGGLNITEGTVEFATQFIRMGSVTIGNGATLRTTQPWTTGSSSSFGLNGASAGSFTVEAGGTLTSTTIANALLEGLTLNGGSVTAPGVTSGDWGAFIIASPVTADGAATSTISAELALVGNQTFDVLSGSTLDITGVIHNRAGATAGAITKDSPGTLTLGGANIYSGNTVVNDGALNVTGSLRFYPSTNGATNSVSGSSTATLSYTGTVNIELGSADATDGNAWTLIDLTGFSSATLNPTAVTSSLGAFTEATAGTWELPVTGAKWVFTEVDGNLAYVNAATPYETWGNAYGLAAGSESGDLDNDGLTNFQEFAFGLIPNSGSSVNPITSQLDKTTGQFSYQRLNGSGLTYTIWTSTDLVNWTEDTTAVQNVTTGSPNDTVQVTLSGVPLTASKLFVRVKAE